MADPDNAKWLYFFVSSEFQGGGLADRLKGITSLFLLALASQRAFGVHWTFPVAIDRFVTSSYIPWVSAPPAQMREGVHFRHCESQISMYCAYPIDPTWQTALISANLPWGDHVFGDLDFRRDMMRLGVDKRDFSAAGMLQSNFFGCIFHSLFAPIGRTRDNFRALTRQLGNAPLVCAQIRMGSAGGQQWFDTEAFIREKDLRAVGAAVVRLVRSVRSLGGGGNEPWVFVTSDADVALRYVRAMVHNRTHARFLLDETSSARAAVHATNAAAHVVDKAMPMLLAHLLLLAQCDATLVTERSGFGRTGLWLNQGTPFSSREEALARSVVMIRNSADFKPYVPDTQWVYW